MELSASFLEINIYFQKNEAGGVPAYTYVAPQAVTTTNIQLLSTNIGTSVVSPPTSTGTFYGR